MLLPLPPWNREDRHHRALVAPLLFACLLLVFVGERLLLFLPPDLGLALGGLLAQARLHSDPPLQAWWQWWSGALVFHDWWQLLIGLPLWLLWAPAIEARLGSPFFLLALALGLPLTSVAALHPLPVQAVCLLAGGQDLLLGLALGLWAGSRAEVLLLIPRLRVLELRRLRLPFLLPALLLLLAEGLRLTALEGLWVWPRPALAALHLGFSVACGVLAASLLDRARPG
jgi:hypothetical protein